MKRFQAEQTQKTFKSKDSCVEISTYVVLGGGQFRACSTRLSSVLKKYSIE